MVVKDLLRLKEPERKVHRIRKHKLLFTEIAFPDRNKTALKTVTMNAAELAESEPLRKQNMNYENLNFRNSNLLYFSALKDRKRLVNFTIFSS